MPCDVRATCCPRPRTGRFASVLALLFPLFFPLWASAQGVALVVDRVGAVSATAPGAPHAVATLSSLPAGTRLRLDAAASLKLLYIASGDEYTVNGPGAADVGATAVAALDGSTVQRRAADAATPLKLRGDTVAMGGIVMRGARLRLRHPVGLVTTPPTRLAWEALIADAPYRVALRDAAGTLLFEARILGLSTALPADLRLAAEMRYTWTVTADASPTPATAATASFEFAPSEVRDEALRLKPLATAPLADRLVYALWLDQAGALGESRQWWQAIAAERPDDEALQTRAQR